MVSAPLNVVVPLEIVIATALPVSIVPLQVMVGVPVRLIASQLFVSTYVELIVVFEEIEQVAA
jgi:hypothetical protein